VRSHASIDSGTKLASIIERNEVDQVEECLIPSRVGTLNLDTSSMVWHESGDATSRLRASAALPGIFPPVVLDGDRHVEGGVGSPMPLGAAIDFAPTRLIVRDASLMDTHPRDSSQNGTDVAPQSAFGVFLASFGAARYRVAQAEKALITHEVEIITIRAGIPGALLLKATK
jgi:predicted acylesterase/phospholipase RssA